MPRPAYPGPPYIGPHFTRPVYPGYAPPVQGPPGHLGDWLNQHRNLPVQEQERLLRGDPNFRRLPPAEQQRVVQQLHQVNQLSEEQRQRRLARAEMIEHLPPQEQMRINNSARRWLALPVDRQALMKNAFRDLRAVDCDILTLGQYLRPTLAHLPLIRYYHPDEFAEMKAEALALGFRHVESGPLVRSSYHARDQVPGAELRALRRRQATLDAQGRVIPA